MCAVTDRLSELTRVYDACIEDIDEAYAETSLARQKSTARKWKWFCRWAGTSILLHPPGKMVLSRQDVFLAEVKMMLFLKLLEPSYAYSTIVAYIGDVTLLQRQWNRHVSIKSLGQSYDRVQLMLKKYKKTKTVYKEKKRLWQVDYFVRIARGQGWSTASERLEWAPFIVRTMWTILVIMYQLILRQGEVVDCFVSRTTLKRSWTRASVRFMAGATVIPISSNGCPVQSWRPMLTHVLLDPAPDKTNVDASRDPFVLQVLSPMDDEIKREGAMPTFLFDGAVLLWNLFTLNPVKRRFMSLVPLFAKAHSQPPMASAQFHQNDFKRELGRFLRNASPVIAEVLHGKRLGGHCMRGAAANHAIQLGATITEVCKMSRWAMVAFVQAKGYDYLRSHHASTAAISAAMMLDAASVYNRQSNSNTMSIDEKSSKFKRRVKLRVK